MMHQQRVGRCESCSYWTCCWQVCLCSYWRKTFWANAV